MINNEEKQSDGSHHEYDISEERPLNIALRRFIVNMYLSKMSL